MIAVHLRSLGQAQGRQRSTMHTISVPCCHWRLQPLSLAGSTDTVLARLKNCGAGWDLQVMSCHTEDYSVPYAATVTPSLRTAMHGTHKCCKVYIARRAQQRCTTSKLTSGQLRNCSPVVNHKRQQGTVSKGTVWASAAESQ